MNKYFVISDIHGDYKKLSLAMSLFNKDKYKKLIILGDVLYHGPRNDLPSGYDVKRCISLLNECKDKIICVKGNCDAEVDQMVLNFKIKNSYSFNFNNVKFYLTHGTHLDKENNHYSKHSVVLYGHTHVYKIENINDIFYINPGSISLPKVNKECSYLIFDKNCVRIYDLTTNNILGEISFDEIKNK
ncbi:MAG: phosphodiesterase [Bacilli bacterium]